MNGISIIALDHMSGAGFLLGTSPVMQAINAVISDVANTDIPVLLVGESGTGKGAYATFIHSMSDRQESPFTKINCLTSGSTALLAQLRDSFAPSMAKPQPGTLFLDGIEELDFDSQRLLLSCIRDTEGNAAEAKTRPRLICSTSKNPDEQVASGRLRRELYFRINGVCIKLPALRERREDIRLLFDFLAARHSKDLERKVVELDPDAVELLCSYEWPGNIRELENVAKKLVALGNAEMAFRDLRSAVRREPPPAEKLPVSSLKAASRIASQRAEREMILKALELTRWNRKRAARHLQVSYKSLLYKIKQLDVQSADSRESRNVP